MMILTQEQSVTNQEQSEPSSSPRIYVCCLSSYNNSKLHGVWIDCDQDAESIQAEIDAMLAASPESDADEWAIHDFENWLGIELGENEDIDELAELAEILGEHGKPYALFREYFGASYVTVEQFQEFYQGLYESKEDFVYEQWEQEGKIKELEKLGASQFCKNKERKIIREQFSRINRGDLILWIFLLLFQPRTNI